MTDREKLIELLEQAIKNASENYHGKFEDGKFCGLVADSLLKKGVIIPPCKVGDTVYLIPTYNGKPYCGVREDKVQMIGITSRGIHIKARNHHDHNKMYMLGKTIFLTREGAEKALAERSVKE